MKLNNPSISFRSKVLTILAGFLVMALWMIGVSHFLTWLVPPDPNALIFSPESTEPPLRYTIFMAFIWAPLWEEMFNRHAYGLIVKQIGGQFLLPAMIISSFIFGWFHGDGALSIMRQGMAGMVFFYVYAKNGFSYWSSVTLHSMWNIFVFISPNWIW